MKDINLPLRTAYTAKLSTPPIAYGSETTTMADTYFVGSGTTDIRVMDLSIIGVVGQGITISGTGTVVDGVTFEIVSVSASGDFKVYTVREELPSAFFAGATVTFGDIVPVWYSELPDGINAKNYILIGQIDSNDLSTKNSQDTSTTIRVTIHTHDGRYNSGDAADTIAGLIMERIYPADKSNIDLSADGLQCVSTDLSGDNLQDYSGQGNRKYIDRTLTFRHYIFQR